MAADRAQLCIEMYWEVVSELSIGTNPNAPKHPIAPKIGNLKTPPLNYSQTLADGAAL